MAEFSFHIDDDLTGAGEFAEATGLNLGNTLAFAVPGQVTHIRWRVPATPPGAAEGALYQVVDSDPPVSSTPGTLLGSQAFAALVANTWQTVELSAPVAVVPGVAYRPATFGSPVGRYRARGTFHQLGRTRNYIYSHADNTGLFGHTNLRNGTFFAGSVLAYPRDNFNATAYFVDVVFVPDYLVVRPDWTPDLSATPGLYALGGDVEFSEDVTIQGVRWYRPAGGTPGDVAVTIYDQLTQAVLATGSALAGDLDDGWNLIELDAPYAGSAGVVYTYAAQSDGTHGYTSSVALPYTSPDGAAQIIQTRYESGGGYPATEWGSGMHGVDVAFVVGGEPEPAEGTLAGNLNLAAALTGSRPSQGALSGTLGLAPALTGARASAGALAGSVGLSPALTGARESLGTLPANLGLAPSLTGARPSLGVLAANLRLTVALTGTNGESGREVEPFPFPPDPVAGWPHPSSPVSGYPWATRPVKSFQEVPTP